MNPYSAPTRQSLESPELSEGALTLLKLYLVVLGVTGLGMALLSPVVGYATAFTSPEFQELGAIGTTLLYSALGLVCVALPSGAHLAGAIGLHRGRSWGWWVSAVCLALQMGTLCTLPFSIAGIIFLMQRPVRAHFGV